MALHLEIVFVVVLLLGLVTMVRSLSPVGCLRALLWTGVGMLIGWFALMYFVVGWFHH